MAVVLPARAFTAMTLGGIIAFATQIILLILYSQKEKVVYTEKYLFGTVLLYTIIMSIIFMELSFYYEGDTFMLSKSDAIYYYDISIKAADVGFLENAKYIFKNVDFDNWGAALFDSLMMYLIADKLFLNAFNMVTGAISAVLLFRIGKHYMPNDFAFLSAMSYATSSYLIFFHCTFLKESLFLLLVIYTVYLFYKAINTQSKFALAGVGFGVVILVFFRPAVSAMIVVSIFAYYAIMQRKRAFSLFLYMGIAVVFLVSLQFMAGQADAYTAGGDMDTVADYRSNASYSSSFNYFVSVFGGLFGPFPTLFSDENGSPVRLAFQGPGIIYRLFLIFPFWGSLLLAWKNKAIDLLPMIIFILAEMLAAGYVFASLELRKVVVHFPFMYTLSFYTLSQWQNNEKALRIIEIPTYTLAIGIMLLWNVIRV